MESLFIDLNQKNSLVGVKEKGELGRREFHDKGIVGGIFALLKQGFAEAGRSRLLGMF